MSHDSFNSYFTLFSLPPHLTIDTAALEKSFYALSRNLPPGRFALPRSATPRRFRLPLPRRTLLPVTS